MRKYHQLILLIISVISLLLFLVYRHEYNRLHYVLEVFNFFGQPCNFTDLQATDKILSQFDWGPSPSWQENDRSYVYAAFFASETEVKAIALQNDSKYVPRNCYVWFEERKKPVVGQVRYSKIGTDENAGLEAYFYICGFNKGDSAPYAVSFSYKPKKDVDNKKILLPLMMNYSNKINTTICVSPTAFNKRRLVEFLSFHKLLGVDYFIFYSQDIPHRLSKLLVNLSNRLDIHVSFLTWNFPKFGSTLVRTLVEKDCLLRTSGRSNHVITLETNEYIVPSHYYNIEVFLRQFNTSERLSLPIQKFCIMNYNPQVPLAVQNINAVVDSGYNVVRYLYQNSEKSSRVSTIQNNHASIHKYVHCSVAPKKTVVDNSMLKFSTDLNRATLVQLLNIGQL